MRKLLLYTFVDDILEERLKAMGANDRKNKGKSYMAIYDVHRAREVVVEEL